MTTDGARSGLKMHDTIFLMFIKERSSPSRGQDSQVTQNGSKACAIISR